MAEQYLQDQLKQGTVDPTDDIIKHFGKQTQENMTISCNKQIKEDICNK